MDDILLKRNKQIEMILFKVLLLSICRKLLSGYLFLNYEAAQRFSGRCDLFGCCLFSLKRFESFGKAQSFASPRRDVAPTPWFLLVVCISVSSSSC